MEMLVETSFCEIYATTEYLGPCPCLGTYDLEKCDPDSDENISSTFGGENFVLQTFVTWGDSSRRSEDSCSSQHGLSRTLGNASPCLCMSLVDSRQKILQP